MMQRQVTLIAPVPPFRGGIAHHSAALSGGFAGIDDYELHIESFARLYPKALYPGESPLDGSADRPTGASTRFDLDTLNPLSWRALVRRVAARGGTAVIPCWTFFAAPCLGWIARKLAASGVDVVMVVHNVGDHEGAAWKNSLTHWQLRAANRFVTHTAELERDIRSAGLTQPCDVIAHPPYANFPDPTGTLQREHALELLCFGLVRPYKGVDIAIAALAEAGLGDVRLTIAGEIWEGEEELRRLAADPRLKGKIEFLSSYQSDQDAAELFARSDALLLPYRSITGSGVLAMAQHYRLPVVASALPALTQPINAQQLGWHFEAGSTKALANLLSNKVTRESCATVAQRMAEPDSGGWARMAHMAIGTATAR